MKEKITKTTCYSMSHTRLPKEVLLPEWARRGKQGKKGDRVEHTQRGPGSTPRQTREQISGPNLVARARLLSFNRTQSRAVIGLLTGHNTLRIHLYVMGLSYNPNCRKCGTEGETSVHMLCECEALASLRHAHLGSFFLDPEDIRKLSTGAIWNFGKGTGLL